MRQFIPFEDDWDMLENLPADALVPYRVGLPCQHEQAGAVTHFTAPISPSTFSSSPICTPMRRAVPAASSNT